MGTFSIWHWVIVLVVVLVLFGGGGKLSRLMGDMARGVTAFKKGLKEDVGSDGTDAATPIEASATAEVGGPATEAAKKDKAAEG
ncbi:MAG: sec-independent protein translocase protein TatA [Alphaproteobacteria bacterium]|jgi:sec-independent protein translocase protein TatA